jgi:AraC-like DNA-binding protein
LLASELGMNAAYLSDLFHRQIGVSFKRYLTERRLRQASVLLRDPLCRISEVAFAVGYTDPNQFRRVFKAWSGQPPRTVQNGSGIAGAASDHQKASSQTFAGFSKVMQLGITGDHAL